MELLTTQLPEYLNQLHQRQATGLLRFVRNASISTSSRGMFVIRVSMRRGAYLHVLRTGAYYR